MAVKQSRRDAAKERFWRETLEAQTRDGQSIREFCREHELAESAFYFWRRELRQREAAKVSPQSGPCLKTTRKASRSNGSNGSDGREIFVPVSVTGTNRESSIARMNRESSIARMNRESSIATAGETANPPAISTIEMTLPSGAILRWSGGDADVVAAWIANLEARLC